MSDENAPAQTTYISVTPEMIDAGTRAGDASYYGSHLIRPLPPELLVDIYRAMRALEPCRLVTLEEERARGN